MKTDNPREAELRLIERYRENGDREALEDLLDMHMAYIRSMAASFRLPNEFHDLVLEGETALIESLPLYDQSSGNRFLTFASPRIRRAMQLYLETATHPVRIPDTSFRRLLKKESNIAESPIILNSPTAESLSAVRSNESLQSDSAESEAMEMTLTKNVEEALISLDPMERELIELSYGIGRKERSPLEISRITGIDRERIPNLLRQAKKHLKETLVH